MVITEQVKLKVGDKVNHYKDSIRGTIISIDYGSDEDLNYFWLNYGDTTCQVLWDDCDELDIQWLSKLTKSWEETSQDNMDIVNSKLSNTKRYLARKARVYNKK